MLGFCRQAPRRRRRRGAELLSAMDVDDTLVLILERIDSAVSLIRAASTCRRWRRAIADAGFLRRHRSLHGPPVAGDYHTSRYHPTRDTFFVPSSSSSPIVDARYFSLDFLVDKNIFRPRFRYNITRPWVILDSRGSLLLMDCIHETHIAGGVFPHLVICEPATQRYKVIPKPPDYFEDASYYVNLRGPYLVDGDEDAAGGRIGMSNFGVLCVLFSRGDDHVARTTMFTVRANATESIWSEKAIDHIASMLRFRATTRCIGHVLGSHYFYVQQDGMLITYNGGTGKFSSSVLSRDIKRCWHHYVWAHNFAVVDGGDGEPRIVVVMDDDTMEVFGRRENNGEWTLEKKIVLSKVISDLPGFPLSFLNGYLMLIRKGVGFVVMSLWDLEQRSWHFSFDLRTMEAASVADGSKEDMVYRCEFPWPPVLQACLDR